MNDLLVRDAISNVAAQHGRLISTADRLAEDLHLDSISRIELAVMLEQLLGRPVADSTALGAHNVADLLNALED